MHKLSFLPVSILMLALSACTTYQPKPLTSDAVSQALQGPDLNHLSQQASQQKIILDFSKPLTPQQLAVIAVITDPDLIALRAQQGVADAQSFSAGLLPDPVISASLAPPMQREGNTNAYSIGPNFDLGSFITSHLQKKSAEAQAQQTHYNIAWQEWLVANQAHLLAVQITYLQDQLDLAKQNLKIAKQVMGLTRQNLLNHETTASDWDMRRSNYFDAEDQVTTLSRSLTDTKLSLNHLLGFPPDANIQIAPAQFLVPASLNAATLFSEAQVSRFDLQALQAGYQSQEIQLHQAILGQFPNFNLGLARARDNSNVNTIGISLTFDLPLWNRNQGQIAIQKATREQLYQEYIARLQQTRTDIATLTNDLTLLQQENQTLQDSEVSLNQQGLDEAFAKGQINLADYADLNNSLLSKQQRLLALEQSMAEQCVALQIAVGKPLEGASC